MNGTPTEIPSDESNLFTRFYRVYTGLPLGERKNVIVIVDEIPINWERAFIEIKQTTDLGKKIVEKLKNLDII